MVLPFSAVKLKQFSSYLEVFSLKGIRSQGVTLKVNIFFNAAVQTKNATLIGALFLQMLFHIKGEPTGAKCLIKQSDLEPMPFRGDPPHAILTISNQP
jgi:hypothetical protein